MRMLSDQKRRKLIHSEPLCPPIDGSNVAQPGQITRKNVWTACPPIQAWMPNHPHATNARSSAGRFDPYTPYDARAKTGKGMPYFVPGCEFNNIGASTIRLPSAMVQSAWLQLIPLSINPDASM